MEQGPFLRMRSYPESGEVGESGVEIAAVPGVVGAVDKLEPVLAEHSRSAEAHELLLLGREADRVIGGGDGDAVVQAIFVDVGGLDVVIGDLQRDFALQCQRKLAEWQEHELVLAELEHIELRGKEAGDLGAEVLWREFDDDRSVVQRFEAELGEHGE